MSTLHRWLRDGDLAVEPGEFAEKWKAEMLNFAEKIAPSGALTYGARGSGKDDRVALGLVAAMAEAKGMLRGSPYAKNRRRTEYGPSDEAA